MQRYKCAAVAATGCFLLSACQTTPLDFATPTMIGQEQGYGMTGFIKAADEATVKARLAKRIPCPNGVDFVSLKTVRADNAMGTKIYKYDAIMKCSKTADPIG